MPQDDMKQFLNIFLQESADHFESLERELLRLEEHPNDSELIYAILRHIHSLKGSAGMFGFDGLKRLGHRLEDLMVLAHQDPSVLGGNVIDCVFEGCDLMQALFRRISQEDADGSLNEAEAVFCQHLEDVIESLENKSDTLEAASAELCAQVEPLLPLLSEVVDVAPIRKALEQVRQSACAAPGETASGGPALSQETESPLTATVARLRGAIDKAMAAPLGDAESDAFFDDMRVLLEAAEAFADPSLGVLLEDARESLSVFPELDLDFDDVQAEYFSKVIDGIVAVWPEPEASAEDGRELDDAQREVRLQRKAVRIDEEKIDAFLDSVGELVILGEVFNNLQKRIDRHMSGELGLMREFTSANALFGKHVLSLHEALLDVRRVAISNVTAGLLRLVRDTAHAGGKQARIEIRGDEAVIDKNMLAEINACLVHLVRNAVDHGIESPEERMAAGKETEGNIRLSACNEEGFLLMTLEDDGRGINAAQVRARAVALGIASAAEMEALSDQGVLQFVFRDGLSTAEKVSDVSGRGVGMGAVLENIEQMGGAITIDSRPGEGTRVTLRVPLSIMLSVIDSLLVRVGRNEFIIPVRLVEESFAIAPEQIQSVQSRGECVSLRGNVIPLRRLENEFHIDSSCRNGDSRVGVLVRAGESRMCLLADEIVDHQQVVVKRIDGLEKTPGILGGALLGDGSIGLVLDVEALGVPAASHARSVRRPVRTAASSEKGTA